MENRNDNTRPPSHAVFTYADKDSLGYASAEELRESILGDSGARIEALERKLDTLLETDDSSAIENFREILGFLEGLTDDERLAARLADIGRRLDEAQGVAARSLESVAVSADGDTVELTATLNDGGGETVPFPMASEAQAGAVTAGQVKEWSNAGIRAFIDLFNQYCVTYPTEVHSSRVGSYNPDTGLIDISDISITIGEALVTLVAGYPLTGTVQTQYANNKDIRVNFPARRMEISTVRYPFYYCMNLEVANADEMVFQGGIWGAQKLRCINNLSDVATNNLEIAPESPLLEVLTIKGLTRSINLSKNPLINLSSFLQIIDAAKNTTPITITVHPDTYAKLTGETTNPAAAALTQEELAKWAQLLSDAAEKEITFTIPS